MLIDFDPFSPDTVLFDQLPGLIFTSTPRVVTTAGGERALSNTQPGDEFNNQSLRIDFTTEQSRVSMNAGLQSSSSAPVEATLTAFDASGAPIAQDGPKPIGPGPVEANTPFVVQVAAPTIRRVELNYVGAFSELIDDLEFDVEGDITAPDVDPPTVNILRPDSGITLTGESFILEAEITEDRKLSEVLVTIASDQNGVTFSASFFGQVPNFKLGPVRTQPLAFGVNVITVTARDFAGNEGQDTVRVIRIPLTARLVVDTNQPIVLRRSNSSTVEVHLEETFPNSLDGRGEIDIRVVGPDGVQGQVRIRDFLNQPEPRDTLSIFVGPQAELGEASVFLQAIDVESDLIIDTADVHSSIVPSNPFECSGLIPYYRASKADVLRREMEAGIDAALANDPTASALTPLQLTLADGEIRIFRRFLVETPHLGFPTADINMSATIVRNPDVPFSALQSAANPNLDLDEDQLPFMYQPFNVNASPNIPVTGPLLAIVWATAQTLFEDGFRDKVKTRLLRDFSAAIYQRLTAANESAILFLQETRITTQEFIFGFCIPDAFLPNPLRTNDFTNDPLDQFEVVDDPDAVVSRPSSWQFDNANELIMQTSNIHGPGNQPTLPNKPGTYLLGVHEEEVIENGQAQTVTGPWPIMQDFAMECVLSSQDDDGIGLVFRYQDVENFYFFLMDSQRGYRRIGKKINGVFRELEVAALDTGNGFDVGADHAILLTARRNEFSVHIDGFLALTGRDAAIAEAGRIGFYSWANTGARFETLTVRPL